MINATEIKRILISLDDIMDMRLGLIKTLNEEVFEKILSKDVMQYITRVNDDYCAEALGWPKEMWYEAYRNRNIDVMKNSVVNHVPNIVTNIILEYLGSNEEAIGSIVFELEVNTFPYQLNHDEKEALRDVLTEMFPIIEQISLVEVDLNNLAPTMIKGKYFIVGIYDFYNWTTTHAEELKKIIMPLVTIIAPRFVKDEFGYLNKKLNDLDSNEKTILQMDPFKLIETTLAHKFRLMFAPLLILMINLARPYLVLTKVLYPISYLSFSSDQLFHRENRRVRNDRGIFSINLFTTIFRRFKNKSSDSRILCVVALFFLFKFLKR